MRNRPATRLLPIILLTAKGEESDIVAGLELGADDSLVKPFSPRVLLARIRTVLRRRPRQWIRCRRSRCPGWVFTRQPIVDAVRGEPHEATDRSVDVHIANRRRKLDDQGGLIETVRGVGYRIRE